MQTRMDIVAVMVGVAVEGPYSYRVPENMVVERGSIVAVPLGPRLILGVVWGAPKDNIAHNRLREVAQVYDVPPLSEELLRLVEWVARYTLAAPGQVLRGVLRSPEALVAVMGIHTAEARHAARVRLLAGEAPAPYALDEPRRSDETLRAVAATRIVSRREPRLHGTRTPDFTR